MLWQFTARIVLGWIWATVLLIVGLDGLLDAGSVEWPLTLAASGLAGLIFAVLVADTIFPRAAPGVARGVKALCVLGFWIGLAWSVAASFGR
jgi:hypothetical protein